MTMWCLLPAIGFYFAASVLYGLLFLGGSGRWVRPAGVFTLFGALLQAVYLGWLIFHRQLDPLALVSFCVVGLFLGLIVFKPWQGLGGLFLPLALILFLFSLSQPLHFLSHQSVLTGLHLLFALATLILLAGGFLFGLFFWLKAARLKSKQWAALGWHLPPLLTNERLSVLLLRLGFVFLTLVLITGALFGTEPPLKHAAAALASWGLFGWLLQKRLSAAEGRKIMLLSALGFVSLVASYLWN